MITLVFPIAIWPDSDECFTVRTLDGHSAAAHDVSVAAAVKQLKKHLVKEQREMDGFFEEPSMRDLEPVNFSITVRPSYRVGRAIYPCPQSITVVVPAVVGRRSDRAFICSAPTLDVQLVSSDATTVRQLMRETLTELLNGSTPKELARHIPPVRLQLDTLNVRSRPQRTNDFQIQLETLPEVADSLIDRGLRRRLGRALRIEDEVDELTGRILTGSSSLVLLGPRGVGKSTLLAAAARRVDQNERQRAAEQRGDRRRMWLTNGSRLISGMQYLGQWEERCEAMIRELADLRGVLCVENLLELVRLGGEGPEGSLAAFFQPYIDAGELRIIGEATPREWDACQRLLPGFAALLEPTLVSPMRDQQSRDLLRDLMTDVARSSRVEFDPDAPTLTHRLFKRFLPYQSLPGRTPQFVMDLIARKAPPLAPVGGRVELDDVYRRFGEFSGLPESLLRDEQQIDFDEMVMKLSRRVVGQPDACRAAAEVITRLKAGLNDPARPLGVMLFCGPTGVGKTELVKALASYLFDADHHSDRLIRLDMSEYSGFGAADRLMVQPNGQPSHLVKSIRTHPFSVVLLDEIEKAAADVFDALLGVLDEGRLTDSFGRTATFRSSVIVMTSNLGASRSAAVGFEPASTNYLKAIEDAFRPEFFNRIDHVVSFQPLDRKTVAQIAEKELSELTQREGVTRFGLQLSWTSDVVELLVEEGFDAALGARPLQRTIERRVIVPISHYLAEHGRAAGRLHLSVDSTAGRRRIVAAAT